MGRVSDPALLAQLNDEKPISDPALLAELEGAAAPPKVGAPEAVLRGAAQGATFGFGDELEAGWKHLVGGADYTKTRNQLRGDEANARSQHPVAYTGGEIGGSLLPSAVAAMATGGTSLAPSMAKAALPLAAGQGALQGAGYSNADTAGGLARDSALGAGVGVAGYGLGQTLGAVGRKVAGSARGLAVRAEAKAADKAAKEVAEQIASAKGALGGEVQKGSRLLENLTRLEPDMSAEQLAALDAMKSAPGGSPVLGRYDPQGAPEYEFWRIHRGGPSATPESVSADVLNPDKWQSTSWVDNSDVREGLSAMESPQDLARYMQAHAGDLNGAWLVRMKAALAHAKDFDHAEGARLTYPTQVVSAEPVPSEFARAASIGGRPKSYEYVPTDNPIRQLQQRVTQSTLDALPGQAQAIAARDAELAAAKTGASEAFGARKADLLSTDEMKRQVLTRALRYGPVALGSLAGHYVGGPIGGTVGALAGAGTRPMVRSVLRMSTNPAVQKAVGDFIAEGANGPAATLLRRAIQASPVAATQQLVTQ